MSITSLNLLRVRTQSPNNLVARSVGLRYYPMESRVLSQYSSDIELLSRTNSVFVVLIHFDAQEYILNIHWASYGAGNDVMDGFGGLEGTNRTAQLAEKLSLLYTPLIYIAQLLSRKLKERIFLKNLRPQRLQSVLSPRGPRLH